MNAGSIDEFLWEMVGAYATYKLKFMVALTLNTATEGKRIDLSLNRVTEFSYSEIATIIQSFNALENFCNVNKEWENFTFHKNEIATVSEDAKLWKYTFTTKGGETILARKDFTKITSVIAKLIWLKFVKIATFPPI